MKKLVLMLACALGIFTSQAQYFAGGQLGLLYDNSTKATEFTIAPEFGYALNDNWTIAGAIGYSHVSVDGGGSLNSFFIAPYVRWTFYRTGIVGLHVDGGFGVSAGDYINQTTGGQSSGAGFEIGLKPGVSFQVTEHFAMVGHVGFFGFREKYLGNSVSGLAVSGSDFGVSFYYTF